MRRRDEKSGDAAEQYSSDRSVTEDGSVEEGGDPESYLSSPATTCAPVREDGGGIQFVIDAAQGAAVSAYSLVRRGLLGGRGTEDISNARQCARAICRLGGVQNTVSAYMELDRRPSTLPAVRPLATLDRYSQRDYAYGEEGEWTQLQLFHFPLFSDDADCIVPRAELEACFPGETIPEYRAKLVEV
jgi:hypothetical protein